MVGIRTRVRAFATTAGSDSKSEKGRRKHMAPSESLSQRGYVLSSGGGKIPALGFGTLIADRDETRNATKTAVEAGFRHFDCAERYRNENQVGAALNESIAEGLVRRADLF